MIIRERRTFVLRARILLQLFQQVFDRPFELRVAALSPRRRIEFDLDVGADSGVLDLPFAVQSVDRRVGRGVEAAVHQRRRGERGDQTAPRAFADERADLRLAEEPRNRVGARSGPLVADYGLRVEDRSPWLWHYV